MVCMEFETGAGGWQAQTKSRSYGARHPDNILKSFLKSGLREDQPRVRGQGHPRPSAARRGHENEDSKAVRHCKHSPEPEAHPEGSSHGEQWRQEAGFRVHRTQRSKHGWVQELFFIG